MTAPTIAVQHDEGVVRLGAQRCGRWLAAALCAELHHPLIVLYRVVDFFDTFFEDAHVVSALCGLVLNSNDNGTSLCCRVPMTNLLHFCLDYKEFIQLLNNVTCTVVC